MKCICILSLLRKIAIWYILNQNDDLYNDHLILSTHYAV